MRIIHICQSSDPAIGGSLVVARSLANAQRQAGIDARVAYLYASNFDAELSAPWDLPCRVQRSSRYTKGRKTLRHLLNAQQATIIHHHDGLFWPITVTSRFAVPLVIHGHLGAPAKSPPSFGRFTHWYICRKAAALISISDWVTASWRESGFAPQKIHLIRNGIDAERFSVLRKPLTESPVQGDSKVLLWVGRHDRETKGMDRLVAVAKQLPSGWSCVILGDGPDRAWLEGELAAEVAAGRVFIVGLSSAPEHWYAAADAFLITSKFESFGLVILEAAASDLPVLAFPCEGGATELLLTVNAQTLSDSGLMGDELHSALAHLPAGPALEEVRKMILEHYTWQSCAAQSLKLYHKLSTKR